MFEWQKFSLKIFVLFLNYKEHESCTWFFSSSLELFFSTSLEHYLTTLWVVLEVFNWFIVMFRMIISTLLNRIYFIYQILFLIIHTKVFILIFERSMNKQEKNISNFSQLNKLITYSLNFIINLYYSLHAEQILIYEITYSCKLRSIVTP